MKKIKITSRNNPQVKLLLQEELKQKIYIFEGEKLNLDILERGIVQKILIVEDQYFLEKEEWLVEKCKRVAELWLVTYPVIKKISHLKNPPPLIGVVKSFELKDFSPNLFSTILVLDQIQDPGNCGGIFRSAAAFNIDCILLAGDSVRPSNRKFLRGAQDAIFEINFIRIENLSQFMADTDLSKFSIYTTSSKAAQSTIHPNEIKIPCMVIFGGEGQGLDGELLARYPTIKIPQNNKINSLNLAVSSSIICYEINKKQKDFTSD